MRTDKPTPNTSPPRKPDDLGAAPVAPVDEVKALAAQTGSSQLSAGSSRTSTSLAELEVTGNLQHRSDYQAKIRDEDREGPRISPQGIKAKKLNDLRLTLNNQIDRTLPYRNAMMIGPLGSRPSDLILWRAIDNYKKEKGTEDPSNIVIVGRRDMSSHLMARRLLRMMPEEQRAAFERDIEVIKTANPKNGFEQTKPKIIFINIDNLERAVYQSSSAKSNGKPATDGQIDARLNGLFKHLGISNPDKKSRLKYLYFDKAHRFLSPQRSVILKRLLGRLSKGKTNPPEVIATSYCYNDREGVDENSHYSLGEFFEYRDHLGSPELLRGATMAALEDLTTVEGTGLGNKGVGFVRDIASKPEVFVEEIKKLRASGKKRIIVRSYDNRKKAYEPLIEALKAEGIKVGWTDSAEKSYFDGKETHHVKERIDLIDKFGEDFDVLVHMQTLDGEEFPADAGLVIKPIDNDDNLELWSAQVSTFTREEEADPKDENIKRDLVVVDRDKTTDKYQSAHFYFNQISERHRAPYENGRHIKDASVGIDQRELPGLKEAVNGMDQIYRESYRVFGGDPHWLEYIDAHLPNVEVKLENGEARLDAKLRYYAEQVFDNVHDQVGFEDLSIVDITRVLRGHQTTIENKRDIIEWAFLIADENTEGGFEFDIQDIVNKFPHLTRIKNLEEASGRVSYVLKNEELVSDINQGWTQELTRVYGVPVETLVAEFLMDYDRITLHHDYTLSETLSVLVADQAEYLSDRDDANELFYKFREFLASKEQGFSVVSAAQVLPERVNVQRDLKEENLSIELQDLKRRGLVQANDLWLEILDKALGVPRPEVREQRIMEYLLENRKASFSSPEELAFAFNSCQGHIPTSEREQEAVSILSAYRQHEVTKYGKEISDADLIHAVPQTVKLGSFEADGGGRALMLAALKKNPQSDKSWKAMLLAQNKDKSEGDFLADLYTEYLSSKIPADERGAVLASIDSAFAFIENLQGMNITKDRTNPVMRERRERLESFDQFLRKRNPDFDPDYKVVDVFPMLFDRAQMAMRTPAFAKKEVATALSNLTVNETWLGMLDSKLGSSDRAAVLSEFLVSQGDSRVFKSQNLKPRLAVLTGALAAESRSKPLQRKTSVGSGVELLSRASEQFNLFREYLAKQGHEFTTAELANVLPGYFTFEEISKTQTGLEAKLVEMTNFTKRSAWHQNLVDNDPERVAGLVASFMLKDNGLAADQRRVPEEAFADQKALRQLVQGLLRKPNAKEVSRDLFLAFVGSIREDLPGLDLSKTRVEELAPASYDFDELVLEEGYFRAYLEKALSSKIKDTRFYRYLSLSHQDFKLDLVANLEEYLKNKLETLTKDKVDKALFEIFDPGNIVAQEQFVEFLCEVKEEFRELYTHFIVGSAFIKVDSDENKYELKGDLREAINSACIKRFDLTDGKTTVAKRSKLTVDFLRDFLKTDGFVYPPGTHIDMEELVLVLTGNKKEIAGDAQKAQVVYRAFVEYLERMQGVDEDNYLVEEKDVYRVPHMYSYFPEALDLKPFINSTDGFLEISLAALLEAGELNVEPRFKKVFERAGYSRLSASGDEYKVKDNLPYAEAVLMTHFLRHVANKGGFEFDDVDHLKVLGNILTGHIEKSDYYTKDEALRIFDSFRHYLNQEIGIASRHHLKSFYPSYTLADLKRDLHSVLTLTEEKEDDGMYSLSYASLEVFQEKFQKIFKSSDLDIEIALKMVEEVLGISYLDIKSMFEIKDADIDQYRRAFRKLFVEADSSFSKVEMNATADSGDETKAGAPKALEDLISEVLDSRFEGLIQRFNEYSEIFSELYPDLPHIINESGPYAILNIDGTKDGILTCSKDKVCIFKKLSDGVNECFEVNLTKPELTVVKRKDVEMPGIYTYLTAA